LLVVVGFQLPRNFAAPLGPIASNGTRQIVEAYPDIDDPDFRGVASRSERNEFRKGVAVPHCAAAKPRAE
jgi:hypothetical protein